MSILRRRCAARVAVAAAGVAAVLASAAAYSARTTAAATSGGGATVASMTADAFNAAQDAATLQRALRPTHLPWTASTSNANTRSDGDDFELTLYRLLGCPFCAKVEGVLQYHRVPYTERVLDPIRGAAPDQRYTAVPQIQLTPATKARDGDNDGVFVVDSDAIIRALARPLGYERDVHDARVQATRAWITTRFAKSSFAITNGTLRDAYATYAYTVPACWQWLPYRLLGTIALHALVRCKIAPQLRQQADTDVGARDATGWLRSELAHFAAQRMPHSTFHGGGAPDLADIEMYAVTRVVAAHPRFAAVVDEGEFGAWHRAMHARMPQT